MIRGLRVLSVLVFLLIVLGGVVRIMGAGLSCPDWPFCFGKIIPPFDSLVFLEWFHRLIAAIVSILVAVAAWIIFVCPHFRKSLGKLMVVALGLLILQIFLGAATVWGLLAPGTVALHLAIGYGFFAHCLLMALKVEDRTKRPSLGKPPLWKLSVLVLAVVYMQVVLGGMVSSHYAGLACPDFPTCFGEWVPTLVGPIKYQFFHRVGALLVTVSLMILLFSVRKGGISQRGRMALRMSAIFLMLQIGIGVGAIHSQLALWTRIAHVAIAAALFASMVIVTYESRRE